MHTTQLQLRVFGLPLTVEIPAERSAALHEQWAWCLPGSTAQRTIDAIAGAEVAVDPHFDEVPLTRLDEEGDAEGHTADYRLTTAVTGKAISACSGQLLMFHAAGIADVRNNRVAGLVTPSGTGKTTATRHLCALPEFAYVTDEALVLNDAGDVLPYPKPLSIIVPESSDRRKSQHGPDELGFTEPPAGELKLGPLILLDRVTEPCPPRLEPVPVLEGLKAVLPQSSAMPLTPNCLEMIAELARRGGGFQKLTYSEISQAAAELLRTLETAPTERDWLHFPGNWPTGKGAPSPYDPQPQPSCEPPLTVDAELERGPFVDALLTDDCAEGLVLIGDKPMHLSGIGAEVWAQLEEPWTVRAIRDFCIETFGDHPQAEELVLEALKELEASRVLVRRGG